MPKRDAWRDADTKGGRAVEAPVTVQGSGSFTPPPAPCGGDGCRYVGFDVVHDDTCEEEQ